MEDLLGKRTFTKREKFEAIEREIKMRVQVYARRVAEGKMKGATMEREIAVMEAILEDYRD